MRSSALLSLFAASSFVVAAPIEERAPVVQDYNAPPGGDVTILNYALTLEYLERKFYKIGLDKFTQHDFVAAGFPDPFYKNLKEIYADEVTHVSFIAGALTSIGAKPVQEATYNFPITDVKSFISLSSVLEGVGVSAYLGAAAPIANEAYLTVAGSILTVEARHSSYIRAALGQSPFPKAFDTPLNFNTVFTLAAQFITGFANDGVSANLPFKAFPPLTIEASQYFYTAGSSPVTFSGAQKNAIAKGLITASTPVYAVFFSGLDTYYVKVRTTNGNGGDFKIDAIPAGNPPTLLPPVGQVYVVLSTADGSSPSKQVNDANTISGVGVLQVSPPGNRGLY